MTGAAAKRFLEALKSIRGSGKFCATGSIPFVFPGLRLKSGEEIAYPLPPAQVKAIRDAAEPAPYGLGAKTKLDESVRRCWQIDASELAFDNPAWQAAIAVLAKRIGEELGVEGTVAAHPYKLLLYEKGGFFLAHRDTEKVPGMFGSLVVSLPSKHSGGELLVRHQGREERIDFAGAAKDPGTIPYAAFFADCEHEVKPVRAGNRLCLTYNLATKRRRKADAPKAPVRAADLLAPILAQLAGAEADLAVILLDHRYTEDGLSVAALKGDDRARAAALFGAAEQADLTARLALVTLYRMGELEEYVDPSEYRRRRWRYDEDEDSDDSEGTMGEVYEESLSLGSWRTPADRSDPLGEYSIGEDRILSLAALDEDEPDETYAEGYTGNAGCTMEHWYRRAAVVVWPREAGPDILARYNFDGACQHFEALAKHEPKKSECRALGIALLAAASSRLETESEYGISRLARSMRPLLQGIGWSGNRVLYDGITAPRFLPVFANAVRETWQSLFEAFGGEPLAHFLAHTREDLPSEDAACLFHALDAALRIDDALALPVVAMLENMLAAAPPRGPRPRGFGEKEEDDLLVRHIHLALAASVLLDGKAARDRLEAVLRAGDDLAHLREALAPALLEKTHCRRFSAPGSLATPVWRAAVDALAAEVARPLPPYPNWSRPTPATAPSNRLARELCDFLADPDREECRFSLPQEARSLLEDYARRHQIDLDLHTEKRGRPYTLVCRKNDRSHQRALARRKADVALLKRLRDLRLAKDAP